MARRPGLVGALALILAACGGPAPSATAIATATLPTAVAPPPSASPATGSRLVIEGTGSVPCPIPGCRASVELIPGLAPDASLDPGYEPVGGWAFDLDHGSRFGDPAAIGPIRDAPATIGVGTYRVVGAASIPTDTPSGVPDASGHYPVELLGWDLCEVPLTVSPSVVTVRIDVAFSKAGGCTVTTGIGIP